ncbi:MAG: hypothetical protein NVSMB18_19190 [Acetobacteraceae bacterium]
MQRYVAFTWEATMTDEARITDHDEILAAARADASRHSGELIRLGVVQLWRLIRRAPRRPGADRPFPVAALPE